MNPIVIAYHLVWTIYGYWLPNDLRGSMSKQIRNDLLKELGDDHYGHKKIQPLAMDLRAFDERADAVLKFPVIEFSADARRTIADAFAHVVATWKYTCYACAIMPDHVHVVVAADTLDGDELIGCIKRAGTRGLNDEGLHPMRNYPRANGRLPSPWAERGWKVMLFTREQMRSRIRYVEENPELAGFKRQRWPFVVPYLG